jgi:O-antigen/teichoic acid export membrane protein
MLNLLVKPFWIFGIDRTVQNVVGAEQYGFYFALFNFSLILNILLDLGITNFNNRNISQNQQLLRKHFSNIIVLRMLLGVGYFIISLTLAWIWNYNWDQLKLFIFLVFNQFMLSLILYLRSNLAGLQLFKTGA